MDTHAISLLLKNLQIKDHSKYNVVAHSRHNNAGVVCYLLLIQLLRYKERT